MPEDQTQDLVNECPDQQKQPEPDKNGEDYGEMMREKLKERLSQESLKRRQQEQ